MAESFVFYESFLKAINRVDVNTQYEVYKAVCEYAIYGVYPSLDGVAMALFDVIQPQIDANKRRRENSAVGGNNKAKNANTKRNINDVVHYKQNSDEIIANANANANANENANVNENVNDDDGGTADATAACASAAHIQKHKYGEFNNVLLTGEELANLKEKYPDWSDRVNRLSEYMARKGAAYKSHYLTILNWAKRDSEKKEQENPDYSDPSRYINMDLKGFRRAADDEFDNI